MMTIGLQTLGSIMDHSLEGQTIKMKQLVSEYRSGRIAVPNSSTSLYCKAGSFGSLFVRALARKRT
jgi:hypothetical protein